MLNREVWIISDEKQNGSYVIGTVTIIDIRDNMLVLANVNQRIQRPLDEVYDTEGDVREGLAQKLSTEIAAINTKLAWKQQCLAELTSPATATPKTC